MKRASKGIKKPFAALIITLGVFLIITLAGLLNVFTFLEYKTYDFWVNLLAGTGRVSDDIIVVLLDQDSIDWANRERGWSWPWPRKAYGEIVDYMRLGGASSVAFDVLFSEPSLYGAEDDDAFIGASRNYGRVVQTVFFSPQSGNIFSWPQDLNMPLFKTENFGSFLSNFDLLKGEEGVVGAQFPIPGLRNTAGMIGNVTGKADPDGIIRRVGLFTLFDGRAVPGLSAASLLVSGADREIRFNQKKQRIEWGDYTIPVDRDGKTLLRFRDSLDRYLPYRAVDILQSAEAYAKGEEPFLPPDNFKDRYVFFGFYAEGLYDIFNTPISSVYPGMGIHISMLDNLLRQDFIQQIPYGLNILICLAAVGVMGLLVFSNRISLAVGGGILILIALTGGAAGAYMGGYWLPLVASAAGTILIFLTGTLYNYATEGNQKRFIKSAFSQYLSPAVIEQIIADPSKLELGGESLEMTAIFTDIQRFSSISEGLQKAYERDGPKELVNLLNLYLTEMSDIVLANQGAIDKFEGDAIIAFFGAPIRTDKHAAFACRAAVQMKKAEAAMTSRVMDPQGRFYPVLNQLIEKNIVRPERPLYTRIGINSGEMVVGNMGTPRKMNYTIMGNAVNLAARLEGVNKQYDTGGILLSEYTRNQLGDEFILRPLSRVRVVGISTPLRLYELLDLREDAPPELLNAVEAWEAAFKIYESRNFPDALNSFKAIRQKNSQDLVAGLYIGRCEEYLKTPPSDQDWDDGVDNLTSK
ncbi:MAG: adenylate/guanylate cyclase domain-containing protein [Treponema sp.]|jgi:class 3 adenylate cyclase/CHASE2 domain-containing sensor protein|nr:adenylate/guanylate cyclase domain-containing protein [Treponema sp.]